MRIESPALEIRRFRIPTLVVIFALGVPYLLRPVARVLLATFAGILLAIFLDGFASLLRRVLPVSRGPALALGILLILLSLVGLAALSGAQIGEQAAILVEQLPPAMEKARSYVMESTWLRRVYSRLSQGNGLGGILGNVSVLFSSTFAALGHLVIIVFTGLYVAVNPGVYSNALLHLLPKEKRPRGAEILRELGQVMRYWLLGRLASMTIIGVMTGVGLLLIDQPLALILGVIAGLLSFIPFLGPLLSAVPAILIGLSVGQKQAAMVAGVFAVVQLIESNLITPLIERRAVMIPPAFVVAGQFLMAVLLGFYGVLLATPLIVLAVVLVQMLYIEGFLGEEVQVLGDRD